MKSNEHLSISPSHWKCCCSACGSCGFEFSLKERAVSNGGSEVKWNSSSLIWQEFSLSNIMGREIRSPLIIWVRKKVSSGFRASKTGQGVMTPKWKVDSPSLSERMYNQEGDGFETIGRAKVETIPLTRVIIRRFRVGMMKSRRFPTPPGGHWVEMDGFEACG